MSLGKTRNEPSANRTMPKWIPLRNPGVLIFALALVLRPLPELPTNWT